MHTKPTFRSPVLILLLSLLTAGCVRAAATATSTAVDARAISTRAAATSFVRLTQRAPSATPTPGLTPTLTPKPFTLDDLRTLYAKHTGLYTKNGNVFLKVGTNPARQLTHSGKDRDPILSDDGMKIVFYRGKAFDNVYSVDADGTHEKSIITSKSLPVLGRGDIKSLTFWPGSPHHALVFNTRLCEPRDYLYLFPACTVGIFITDIDTGKTTELIAGLSGDAG